MTQHANDTPRSAPQPSAGAQLLTTTIGELLQKSGALRSALLVLVDENGTPCVAPLVKPGPAAPVHSAELMAAVAAFGAQMAALQLRALQEQFARGVHVAGLAP